MHPVEKRRIFVDLRVLCFGHDPLDNFTAAFDQPVSARLFVEHFPDYALGGFVF
eukprot:CAMPEP_0182592106 /NCGR_PEP_ID=MMETSP1324-20130603/75261_1 /TAXON_ID=236786 /ORGANISM="Florenciella sp., Strain RCC1587" /LENGTH=53 /DNA_ID=CAMNT_0024809475 /DNA_START=78 /DNA_END=236 /DNA_ORIENTATION=-